MSSPAWKWLNISAIGHADSTTKCLEQPMKLLSKRIPDINMSATVFKFEALIAIIQTIPIQTAVSINPNEL